MWLENLLVLSMLQHPGEDWAWGRYVVLHPAANTDFAETCDAYRSKLADASSFSSIRLESLVDADALPETTATVFRDRYMLPGAP